MKILRAVIRLNMFFFFALLTLELSGVTCVADDLQIDLKAPGTHQGVVHLVASKADKHKDASATKDLCRCPCHGSFSHNNRQLISPVAHLIEGLPLTENHCAKDTSPNLFQPPQYLV